MYHRVRHAIFNTYWYQYIALGLVFSFTASESARILGIFPTPSISHQVVFRGLTLALQKRGHELTIVTPNPLKNANLKNYTEIDLSFLYANWGEIDLLTIRREMNWVDVMKQHLGPGMQVTEAILDSPEFKKLYESNSNEHFDLVIMEALFWHAMLPIAKRFDAPLVGVVSLGLPLRFSYSAGNPPMPSYLGNFEMASAVDGELTFWKRLRNYYDYWQFLRTYENLVMVPMREIAEKHFGDFGSTLDEIERNISVLLTYQHLPIAHIRPNVPKIISVAGYHVSTETISMSKELKEFLDEATDGFVYMSLGTNFKSAMLPKETLDVFLSVFSKIPFRVLWKFEDDVLPGLWKNVRTMKWVPQQAVLAHPNIKVFIYQGGLQSTEEAISHAVPLLGLPIHGDQDGQVLKMVSIGVAKKLNILDLKEQNLIDAINVVGTNSSYKQKMLELRELINDRPYDPLEHAIWWVEHVIRHNGISYLHSSTADLPWYQRGDIDLVAFITTISFIVFSILLGIAYLVLTYVFRVASCDNKVKLD